MKRHMTLMLDLLTFVLFVPFLIFICTTTSLAVAVVLKLDARLPTQTETIAQPRLHYVKLPPAKPAPVEAVAAQPTSPVDPAQEQSKVSVVEVEPPAVEAQNADEPAEILAADGVQAETITVEPAPIEIVEAGETPETESTATPEANQAAAIAEPVLEQEQPAPEPVMAEVDQGPKEPPPVTSPAEPAQPAPTEPAPVPDASYFDKLLEQVKQ